MRAAGKMIKIINISYLIFLLIFSMLIFNLIDPQPLEGRGYVRDYITPVCSSEFCVYGVIVYTDDVIHTSQTFIYLSKCKSITYKRTDMILRYDSESGGAPMINIASSRSVDIFEGRIYSLTKYKQHVSEISIKLNADIIYSGVESWVKKRSVILFFYVTLLILFMILNHSVFMKIFSPRRVGSTK